MSEATKGEEPTHWMIFANPVWGRAETVNRVAVFDKREDADAYIEASLLPEDLRHKQQPDGIYRTYRPDSLLWDYNGGNFRFVVSDEEFHQTEFRGHVHAVTQKSFDGMPAENRNPIPPSGEVPELTLLDKPRYGVDYDVGPMFQEEPMPRTNKNDEVP